MNKSLTQQAHRTNIRQVSRKLAKRIWRYRVIYLFLLPAIIWFFVIKYIPMYGITLGFKDYQLDKGIMGSPWVGMRHLKQFLTYYDFWPIIFHTLSVSLVKLFLGFPMPIILALMLNEVKAQRFKRVIQTVSYLPHFVSWVVVVAFLNKFLTPYGGIINEMLSVFNIEPIYFMGEPEYFLPLVLISHIWKGVGWGSIIYLATISGIDPTLYEAATIDGASKWNNIVHITLPGLFPTIGIMFLMDVGHIMNAGFDQIYLMQTPANLSVSEVLDTYVVKSGIKQGLFSYATVIGLFQSVVGFFLVIILNKLSKTFTEVALW